MRTALKEWAVVIEALAAKRQIFLLRKGGIAEGRRGFELQRSEFLLYPTWEHQQEPLVSPRWRELFQRLAPATEDEVTFRYWAKVEEICHAPTDRERLKRAADRHVWADEYVDQRYDYRPDLPLFLVLVQIQQLASPVSIPFDRRYRGCRSWVDLADEIPLEGSRPIWDEAEYEEERNALLAALKHG